MMERFRLEIERKEERDIWGKEKVVTMWTPWVTVKTELDGTPFFNFLPHVILSFFSYLYRKLCVKFK